jgi:immunity protein, SdpI family
MSQSIAAPPEPPTVAVQRHLLRLTANRLPTSQAYAVAAALILVSALPTLIAYPHLPNFVPVPWDTPHHGIAFGPKWSLFLYTPGLMIGIVLMFIALPRLSPRRFAVNSSHPSRLYVMIVIMALLSYSQLLILLSGLGWNVDTSRAIGGGLCLLLALLASGFAKLRPRRNESTT